MMNFRVFLLFLLSGVPGLLSAAPPGYKLAKEKGVIYLRDILEEDQKIHFKVVSPTSVFATKDAATRIGAIAAGQTVELEGFTPFALRVRGQGSQGIIIGWVNPKDLEAPEPGMLDALKQMALRREQVAKLVAAKQVAIGMTPAEVAESRGEPTKRESRQTAAGRTEVWEYIAYEIIPRYDTVRDPITGAPFRRFSYNEKIEKGKTSVEFKDGLVAGISEMEDLSRKKDLQVVPSPVEFSWP